ncbi:hypothetical protein HJ590_13135 [Naumannella sp. ID2617S]|nr:hypothetical protein [Naumannella sp. ID2617S]
MSRIVMFDDGCGFVLRDRQVGGEWVEFCTKLDGWIEGSDIRSESVPRITDGGFPSVTWRAERKFTVAFSQWCDSRAELLARARTASGTFRSGSIGGGVITVDDPDSGVLSSLDVSLDGRPKVLHNEQTCRLDVELPLISPDPYLYGDPQVSRAVTGNAGQGLEYPLFDDQETGTTTGVLEYGDIPLPPVELTNGGNATAYPVVEVSGNFPAGFVLDITSGGQTFGVTYNATVGNAAAVVDMSGSVTVAGVDQSWALTRRDWGGVEPGRQMTFSLRSISAEGSGYGTATLRATYL